MMKCKLLLLLLSTCFAVFAQAQNRLTGRVTSEDGKPLSGVTLSVAGARQGTTTDGDGRFVLAVRKGATVVFSYVSYDEEKVLIADKADIDVVLKQKKNDLNEVIVIGYGTQKRKENTAAISTVSGKEILKSPVSDITNSLVGRVSGVFAQQRTGRPGDSGADIAIRGRSSLNSAALIIVDGVERQGFGDIDPNEIENITVLKDASSTALFGIKGANGVIIVTTKSGKPGRNQVSFSSSVGIVGYTALPQFLGAYESASLHTEGEDNLIKYGLDPARIKLFSAADLQTYKDGTGDPLLYPNVNWYKELTRPSWLRTQQNINFSGGTKKATYFVSFGYFFEDGMFKKFNTPDGYSTTPSFTRYNFRSNLDFRLTSTTTLGVKIAGRLENRYSPVANSTQADLTNRFGGSLQALIARIAALPAWGIPFFPEYTERSTPEEILLDDTYNQIENQGRSGSGTQNPYLLLKRNGYVNSDNNVFESVFTFDQKMDFITKGLAFKGLFGYDAAITGYRAQIGSGAAYNIDAVTKQFTVARSTFDNPIAAPVTNRVGYIKSNLQLGLNYNREFGPHNVTGVFVAQRELRGTTGANAPFANQGFVVRAAYNYNSRYFFEVNGAYNGSENYAKGYRYGLFPAVSAGWNLMGEKFLSKASWIDQLKIRSSYGLIGYGNINDNSRFLYLDAYARGGAAAAITGGLSGPNSQVSFGNPSGVTNTSVVFHSSIGNPGVTFEKSIKKNIGIDAVLLKNKIAFTSDFFHEKRYDILLTRNSSVPAVYGETQPSVNYGQNQNKGYELELRLSTRTGPVNYNVVLQYTHAKNLREKLDEPVNLDPSLKQASTPIGQFFGYRVIGFYQDLGDIASSPVSRVAGPVIPGDLKYADLSGPQGKPDGVIDGLDQTAIGYSDVPENVFGIEPRVSYKGLSLSALFQGATHVSSNIAFTGNGLNQYYPQMLNHWTPDNQNPAWPAIKPGNYGSNPSYSQNSFLLQDASYVKMRNVELSYVFSKGLLQRWKINSLRVFINGQNLITWTKMVGLDPESAVSQTYPGIQSFLQVSANAYPVTKVYNFGFNVQF